MRRRLVLTRAAERDLVEQVDYIGAARPSVARRYVVAVFATFDRLQAMTDVGVVRSFPVRGYERVRVWPVPGFRRFLIIYRATSKTLEVIRVLHSARDIPRALKRS